MLDTLQQIISRLASSLDALASIGVACHPGLGRRDVPLAATLSAAFGVPVTVESDARAEAWGEYRFGAHRAASLATIFIGSGVGLGAVLDGTLARDAGDLGDLAQYVSGAGFRHRYQAARAAGVASRLDESTGGDPDALTADMVAAAANSGDELARRLWGDARRRLTLAAASVVERLDPELLIFGGGVVEDLPELVDEIAGGVMMAATAAGRESLRIERSHLGGWGGVLGAAALGRGAAA